MLMRSVLAVTVAVGLALPAAAKAPAQPTTPAPAPAAGVSDKVAEEPSVDERRIVAFVSTGVAVASLATGITVGVLAQVQFDCAKDIINCNGDLENKVVDACLQFHGGAGYMEEYRISRMFADARVSRIFAGSNEIMQEIIGRSLAFCMHPRAAWPLLPLKGKALMIMAYAVAGYVAGLAALLIV